MSDHADRRRLGLIPVETGTDRASESEQCPGDSPDTDAVLDALGDETCRAILAVLSEPRSASEVCEACDLSRSTGYRKLDRLDDAGLVREYTAIERDGPNLTVYERDVTGLSVGIEDGLSVELERRATEAEDRLATFWSAMREES